MVRLAVLSAVALRVGVRAAATPRQESDALSFLSDLNDQAIQALQAEEDGARRTFGGGCSPKTAKIRKDWAALSTTERKEYIDAVLCLQSLPAQSDPEFAPGAQTRYDDFVAIHINKTLEIHGTGNFLTWHRYFTWAYENALKEECGYTGQQPYWNWFANQDDLSKSPVYDGSDTSMSGDGAFVAHNGSVSGSGNILLPSGAGGGCIESGPFKDMVVNLGPVSPGMDGLEVSPTGPLGLNPRCLRRDLSSYALQTWMTTTNLQNVTTGEASTSVLTFQNELQGRFGDLFLGMHAAGHFAANGDASDLFASPTDPSFFLHHGMVDRLYWAWQAVHLDQADTIAGTITILNTPPSRDALKEDMLDVGVTAEAITIGDALSTLGGSPFCYIYQ